MHVIRGNRKDKNGDFIECVRLYDTENDIINDTPIVIFDFSSRETMEKTANMLQMFATLAQKS